MLDSIRKIRESVAAPQKKKSQMMKKINKRNMKRIAKDNLSKAHEARKNRSDDVLYQQGDF